MKWSQFRRKTRVFLTVAVCTVGAERATGEDLARGVVYEDRNANGQRDQGEPGVAEVPVSNQLEVVLTDAEGGYALPITDDTIGAFNNAALGQMYVDFVATGGLSLIDGLSVGAEIEDMDLFDLYAMIENYPHDLLQLVGFNLAKGSRNHLRAFVRALAAQDVIYAPIYLDQETFDAILGAEMERRMFFDADGEPVAACGGAIGGFGIRRGNSGNNGNSGQGTGSGSGTGECDGTGSASSECDGTGPHGGTSGGNGSGSGGN